MATQAMDFNVDESDDDAPSELRFELRHFKTGEDTEDTPVSYWLEQGVTIVGRNPGGANTIKFDDSYNLSGEHAELEWCGDELIHVRDNKSTNGSWISTDDAGDVFRKLKAETPSGNQRTYVLTDGNILRLAKVELRVVLHKPAAEPAEPADQCSTPAGDAYSPSVGHQAAVG
jgi:pSer/pThr/pTyr-binding forkhead associated (FHA) protein